MNYRKACIAERVLFGNERRLSNNNNNKTFRLEQLILFVPHCNNRPRCPLVVFEKKTVIPSTTPTKTKRKKKEKEKEKKGAFTAEGPLSSSFDNFGQSGTMRSLKKLIFVFQGELNERRVRVSSFGYNSQPA